MMKGCSQPDPRTGPVWHVGSVDAFWRGCGVLHQSAVTNEFQPSSTAVETLSMQQIGLWDNAASVLLEKIRENMRNKKNSVLKPLETKASRCQDALRFAEAPDLWCGQSVDRWQPGLALTGRVCVDVRPRREGKHRPYRHPPAGFGLYLFDYKPAYRETAGFGRQFGVMADEVEAVLPQAVVMYPDGYKMVDYAAGHRSRGPKCVLVQPAGTCMGEVWVAIFLKREKSHDEQRDNAPVLSRDERAKRLRTSACLASLWRGQSVDRWPVPVT